ncbi:Glycogen [starch] synthase [Bienertia sinuspersici]
MEKKPDNIVSRLIHQKYGGRPMQVAKRVLMPANTSWAFKSMVKCAKVLLPGCGRRIGNETERWYKGFEENKEKERTGSQNLINHGEITSRKWGNNIQEDNILKMDGAWKEMKNGEIRAAYGWVMGQGSRCIQERASKMYATSPFQAEAHALLEGSSNARNEWSQIVIWTDSTELTQLLHKPESAPSSCYFLIIDILNVLKSFSPVKFIK